MSDYAAFAWGADIEDLAKGPPLLPEGDYPVMIQKYEKGRQDEKWGGKPYVRLIGSYIGWPDGAEPQGGIDLGRRQWKRDFFMNPEAQWVLGKFLKQSGITGKITEEAVMQLIGRTALAVVRHVAGKNGQTYAEVRDLIGTGA